MRKKLGEILVEASLIDSFQLQAALGHQRQWGGRLGEILVSKGFVTEAGVAACLAEQLGMTVVDLGEGDIDPRAARLLPVELAERHHLVAYGVQGERALVMLVATADPTNLASLDEVQFRTGKRVQAAVSTPTAIGHAIRYAYFGEPIPKAPPGPEPVYEDRPVQARLTKEDASELPELADAEPPELDDAELPELDDDALEPLEPPAEGSEESLQDALDFLGVGAVEAGDPLARPAEVQAILEAIDALAAGREAPAAVARYVNPTQLIAALVRLLIHRGVIDEAELVDELHRK